MEGLIFALDQVGSLAKHQAQLLAQRDAEVAALQMQVQHLEAKLSSKDTDLTSPSP